MDPDLGIGEVQVSCAKFKPLLQLEKGSGELQIGIGKHRIIAFGMTGRNAGHGSGLRMEVAIAPGEELRRLAQLDHFQVIGFFLVPLNTALRSEDAHG